jgi:hypothetical protein
MIAFASKQAVRSVVRGASRSYGLRRETFAHSRNEQQSANFAIGYGVVSLFALATTATCQADNAEDPKRLQDISAERYSSIIVGGGTAGCTVAYMTAKWMQDNHIPGKVLLVDKGVHFFSPKDGPNPRMSAWFENWGIFGQAHPALREDGTAYPVTVSPSQQ